MIRCHLHGEHVVSLISKYHQLRIINGDKFIENELVSLVVYDDEDLFNGEYLCDSFLVKKLKIDNRQIHVQNEPLKFEAIFSNLVPVCPICLNKYLNDE